MIADADQVLIYAHRGASEQYAEHTRAAYFQALTEGADGVECDVRLTADGEVVLLHDATLERTSNGTGPVAEKTLAELRELDFSSWKGAELPPEYGAGSEQFLTLDELLGILREAGRPVGLAIEFKHPTEIRPQGTGLERRTLDLLSSHGWQPSDSRLVMSGGHGAVTVSFMSFNPGSVSFLRGQVPAVHLCQLMEVVDPEQVRMELGAGPFTAAGTAAVLRRSQVAGERLLATGAAGIAGPGVEYLQKYPQRSREWVRLGRRLRVWTVDTEVQLALCQALGVQEVTTNRPAWIRELLGGREAP